MSCLLIFSVLSPVLNMPISDSKRQRVLVTTCVLYSEVSSPHFHILLCGFDSHFDTKSVPGMACCEQRQKATT